MKFHIKWIKKYIKNNLNIKNIINLLNNNGFEINCINLYKNKKYIIKKIISYKKYSLKWSYIKIKYKKKIHKIYTIYIKENIKNKYILINKKDIKNNFFFIKKKQYYKDYIFILYKKNNILNKNIKYLNKINLLEINIPYNKTNCNNIYSICKEISIIIKKKIKINLNKIKKIKKNKIIINNKYINKNIINYKYIIIKNIKNINKKININNENKLNLLNIKINNNIKDIINYILIESGQKIVYLDLDKIIKFNKINNKNIIKIKEKFLIKKNIKKYYIKKNTKNLILISPLYNYKYFIKKNFYNKKIDKYISNNYKNIQNIFLQKTSEIIKKIYKGNLNKINIIYNLKNNNKKKKNKILFIKYNYIKKKIGFNIKKKKIINILKLMEYKLIKKKKKYISIKIPKWKNNINIVENIISEILKIYGYNKIPIKNFKTNIIVSNKKNISKKIYNIKNIITNIGYKEIINFPFTNKIKENIFFKKKKNNIKIYNPLLKNMKLLRYSLIPNMIDTLTFNIKKQQQESISFFEIGTCFKKKKNNKIKEIKKLSLLRYGYKNKNKWYIENNFFDFYDIKGDLIYLFKKKNKEKYLNIKKSNNKILDKYQNTDIYFKNKKIGYMGMLNKKIQYKYSLKYSIFLFEIKIKNILFKKNIKINKISKYQNNKRDITLIIDEKISINNLIKTCFLINKKIIKKINIIKIYKNNELKKNKKKNITLRLNIQNNKKTLKSNEINNIIYKCKKILKKKFNALIN